MLKSTTSCGVCKMVVNYLDAALEQNATEAQIKTMLDKVCSVLPIGKEVRGGRSTCAVNTEWSF